MDTSYQNGSDERISELLLQIRELEQKVSRLQRERGVYAAKTRLLTQELEKYHSRELRQDTTVDTLLERQREMHVMLNRSNIMLAKAQNATAMLSLEFGELARALPETIASAEDSGPSDVEAVTYEIDDRIRRINDLFKKTGELSEEIAETLQSSKETADGAATRYAGDSRPGTAPPSWSQQQPQAPPAAEAAVSETARETTTSTPDTAPSQPPLSGQPPAKEPEEEVVVEAIYEVTETGAGVDLDAVVAAEAVADDYTDSEGLREPAEESHSHSHEGVPPPQDIFVAESVPTPRMGYRRSASGGKTASSSSTAGSQAADASDRPISDVETHELLDMLEREQQDLDKSERTRPRRSFWSRLLGG